MDLSLRVKGWVCRSLALTSNWGHLVEVGEFPDDGMWFVWPKQLV